MEPRNATPEDAKLILKLYDLRREPLMRKAREYVNNFFPQSANEFLQLPKPGEPTRTPICARWSATGIWPRAWS